MRAPTCDVCGKPRAHGSYHRAEVEGELVATCVECCDVCGPEIAETKKRLGAF